MSHDKITINYRNQPTTLCFVPYLKNKNTALQLIHTDTFEPIEIVTTNVEWKVQKDVLMIYDTSDNKDLIKTLIRNNVINDKPVATYKVKPIGISAYPLTELAENIRVKQYNSMKYEHIFNK